MPFGQTKVPRLGRQPRDCQVRKAPQSPEMEYSFIVRPRQWSGEQKEVKIVAEVSSMAETVGEMTKEELREMLDVVVEQKLIELLGDPDEGLEIREELRERLLQQMREVSRGERGQPLKDVSRDLGIE